MLEYNAALFSVCQTQEAADHGRLDSTSVLVLHNPMHLSQLIYTKSLSQVVMLRCVQHLSSKKAWHRADLARHVQRGALTPCHRRCTCKACCMSGTNASRVSAGVCAAVVVLSERVATQCLHKEQ